MDDKSVYRPLLLFLFILPVVFYEQCLQAPKMDREKFLVYGQILIFSLPALVHTKEFVCLSHHVSIDIYHYVMTTWFVASTAAVLSIGVLVMQLPAVVAHFGNFPTRSLRYVVIYAAVLLSYSKFVELLTVWTKSQITADDCGTSA